MPSYLRSNRQNPKYDPWAEKWQELIDRGVVWSDEEWARRIRSAPIEDKLRVSTPLGYISIEPQLPAKGSVKPRAK